MNRVVVAGCAGNGKSTLARELAARTGLPLIERDALGILGSEEYQSAISQMAAAPCWILDGAPYYADEFVYAAADTVIFLDYPKLLVMWRVLRRTLRIELSRRLPGHIGRKGWRPGATPNTRSDGRGSPTVTVTRRARRWRPGWSSPTHRSSGLPGP